MDTITVQCVYGKSHLRHIEECMIPALKRSTARLIRFITINYDPLSSERIHSGFRYGVEVIDIKNESSCITGFASNHNTIFNTFNPKDYFVIINPDCIPHKGSIDRLINRKKITNEPIAIVEGRQWPFEHPKEYDPLSLHTPWASGAFCLIDADFYRLVDGIDDIYFIYMEDVDLSWQAWLNGYSVIYEPTATVTHFSGERFYRNDIISNEQYFSIRNFLIISKKFFGEDGELMAIKLLNNFHDKELAELVISEYKTLFRDKITKKYEMRRHKQVKILGLGIFHNLREV